jgi:hypothetical protein
MVHTKRTLAILWLLFVIGTIGAAQADNDYGPKGLLVAGPGLIVVNQNVNQPVNGEILQYHLRGGSFAGRWVANEDQNEPFAPRSAALKNGVLYVANFAADGAGAPGEILVFACDEKFLRELTPPPGSQPLHPRGVVTGPNDLLYVSSDPNAGGTARKYLT